MQVAQRVGANLSSDVDAGRCRWATAKRVKGKESRYKKGKTAMRLMNIKHTTEMLRLKVVKVSEE